ncbi:FmdB family zinc ribbon protein [Metallibacterium sp.]
MPIYAYKCNACGHAFDRLQKLSDPAPAACPTCGAARVQRQVTAPAFRLAGGGWYETDFKKDGQRNVVRKDEAPVAASADKPAAEAKPAVEAKPASASAHSCGSGCGCG